MNRNIDRSVGGFNGVMGIFSEKHQSAVMTVNYSSHEVQNTTTNQEIQRQTGNHSNCKRQGPAMDKDFYQNLVWQPTL